MKNDSTLVELRGHVLKGCSVVTVIIYLLIALLLVVTAVAGFIDTVLMIINAVQNPVPGTLTAILQSILFLIIIVTLIDMVRSYVKLGRVLLRPIFIAGITTMVRRLLVDANLVFIDLLGNILVIIGLTACLIFLSIEERKTMAMAKELDKKPLDSEEYE
ncbi:MAG TPA: phosphate-starvation-inducible PsiE family protein [Methanocorpusculum sp.]|nr:phosphate-starvation-inducible PsiE family protein [Methanocorpusculum sp.]